MTCTDALTLNVGVSLILVWGQAILGKALGMQAFLAYIRPKRHIDVPKPWGGSRNHVF